VLWGILLLVATGVFFFRMTGSTGCVLFLVLSGILIGFFAGSPSLEAGYIVVLIPLWIWGEKARGRRRRHYLPAIASVPGGGIKRGLTVPEAAVVLEQPLGRVLTLVLFGMLKKGLLRQGQPDPLRVEVTQKAKDAVASQAPEPPPPVPEATPQGSAPAPSAPPPAPAKPGVIRAYEPPFLKAFAKSPGLPVQQVKLDDAMKALVTATAKKLAGFDLEQTKEYYLSIVNKAWQDAKALGDLEKRTEFVDDNLEWLLLSDGYGGNFHTWHQSGYDYSPSWTRGGTAGGVAAPLPSTGGTTSFGDVAASFAGWSENLSGHLASAMDPVSMGLVSRGAVNLGGVDRVTGDVLKAMASSSGGGGGGGGGGCACACAGCACACACAGGGR